MLHVDETPGRAAGGLTYVHVACTEFLTALHTEERSAATIDAGGVLPGYPGVVVRDGYAGYTHLLDAVHAWCGAHLLRDLRAFYNIDPDRQRGRCSTPTGPRRPPAPRDSPPSTSRRSPHPGLLPGAVAKGLTDNHDRRGHLARDALTLARRFRDHEDMILRFATDLTVGFTNNQAERDVRPVKVQQRSSGGG